MISLAIEEKRFANSATAVLHDIHIKVKPGELVALIGPSGAGKSTLLQIASGLDSDFSGQVDFPKLQGRAAKVGYMFQQARLMPWLSVLDNVCLVAAKKHHRKQAIALLQAVGLGDKLYSYPGQLSGGMQRRVALARAFIHQPDILLMDEPFVSLDSPAAEELRQLVLTLWQEQQTAILLVTHNLDEAIAMADRILFLSSGPASVILETVVAIERPRQRDQSAMQNFKQQLLASSPALLAGHLATY
jgi:NitT/TauT family transport system ATP-binding protein